MNIFKKIIPYILILLLSFFAIAPLLSAGFFPIHDDTQVTRVFEMTKALKDGMFPVRWSLDLGFGYGYPIFNFYAPLAYYIGSFITFFGVNALDATKIMMTIGILFSGLSMYVFAKELFGKWAGVLASMLYVYAPYHAVDMYVRGDVSEAYAYGFIPLLFYGLYKINRDKNFISVVITATSLALVVASHNLTALMITPFAIVFAAFLFLKNKENIYKFIVSFILGISLTAFYWIPAIFEMGYTNVLSQIGGGASFKDHFVCLNQLWASPWGYGGSAKGCIDGVSFMLGKYHILLFFIAIALVIVYLLTNKLSKFTKEQKQTVSILLLFILFTIFSVFLTLSISAPIWNLIKPMEFFQFPWRFLIVAEFAISLVGAGGLWIVGKNLKNNYYYVLSIFLVVGIVLLNLKFFVPQTINNKTVSDYTNREEMIWNISKTSSEYMPKDFSKPKLSTEVANFNSINNQNLTLLSYSQKTQNIELVINANKTTPIIIPLAYFPAWKALVDNKNTVLYKDKKGIRIDLNTGRHKIILQYFQTSLEVASDLISIAGILAIIIGIIYSAKRYDKI